MSVILTRDAPIPLGHYSQAIVDGGLVYVSGQLPLDPETGNPVTESVEAQVRRVLRNLDAVLVAAGSRRDRVLKVSVYISDVAHWPTVNRIYAEFFGDHRPARTAVPVGALHLGVDVEIDAIARIASA